jgi:hypothetical protein
MKILREMQKFNFLSVILNFISMYTKNMQNNHAILLAQSIFAQKFLE